MTKVRDNSLPTYSKYCSNENTILSA